MTFEIGDKVIYPNHGLGTVERIETKTIMGTTCGFYQLRMANETMVLVPVDNVDGVGLRRAISDEEVQRLFGLLGDGRIDSHQNWKGRFKDNSDRMRTGSIYDVVEVLKSLTFLSKSKSLSFREKRMLDRAKFLVVSEMSEVMGMKTPAIEAQVEKALDECFATKARVAVAAKAKAPVAAPAPIAVVATVQPVVAAAKPVAVAPARPVAVATAKPVAVVAKPVAVAKPAAAKSVAKSAAVKATAKPVGKSAGRKTAPVSKAAVARMAPRRAVRAS